MIREMICERCEQLGGFEGDPPAIAGYLVTVTGPTAEAEANAREILCGEHASQAAAAYIGWGWAFHMDFVEDWFTMQLCCEERVRQHGVLTPTMCSCGRTLVVRDRTWQVWVSSLVEPCTNTTPTGG